MQGASLTVVVDAFTHAVSLEKGVQSLERMVVLLGEVDKYKDLLGKAVNSVDLLKATEGLAKINKEVVKIQQEEEKLAAQRQKNVQAEVVGQEKIQQEKAKTASAAIRLKQQEDRAAGKANRELKNESGLLGKIEANIRRIKALRFQADTEAQVARVNRLLQAQIAEQKRLQNVGKQTTNTLGNALSSFQFKFNFLGNLAATGVAAASASVQDFLADSIHSFIEAEQNANQLKFAITQVGGEGAAAFDKLMTQSEELQKNGIFSDDAIQQAQTQLANYGLTSDQIQKLIPQITDLAAAAGIDLSQATDKVISGINGQTKGLKSLGIMFKDTGSRTENLAIVTEKLTKFQGANAAQLTTTAGKIIRVENAIDDLKEVTGEFLVERGSDFLDFFEVLTGQISLADAKLRMLTVAASKFLNEDTKKIIAGIEAAKVDGKELSDAQKEAATNAQINLLQQKRLELHESILAVKKEDLSASEKIAKVEKLMAQSNAINIQIQSLNEYKAAIADVGGDDDTSATKGITDLSDKIEDEIQARYNSQLEQQKDFFRKRAEASKEYARLTTTDEVDLANYLLKVDQELIQNLADLDRQKAVNDASRKLAELTTVKASEEQKADLVVQINLKLQQDLADIDRKTADEKLKASKDEFDKLFDELSSQNDKQVAEAERLREKEKEKEKEAFEENQRLRVLQAKKDQDAIDKATILNAEESRDMELAQLEADYQAGLIAEADYQRKKQLIIAESNEQIAAIQQERFSREVEQIQKITSQVAEAVDKRREKQLEGLAEQLSDQQENIERQRQLAASGDANTLAFEERERARLRREELELERQRERAKKREAYFNLFAEYAKKDPDTALTNTIRDIAFAEAGAAIFAEKGGIAGEVTERVNISPLGLSKSHAAGDVVAVLGKDEGILTGKQVENLGGREGFYSLAKMLENPVEDSLFSRQSDNFALATKWIQPNGVDPVIEKLDSVGQNLERAIKNIPGNTWSVDSFGNFIHKLTKQGHTVITNKGPLIRPHRRKTID